MIKRKFSGALRSKTLVAQENEVLAKFLCHNLACLVHATYELGVAALFWQDRPDAADRQFPVLIANSEGK